MKIVDVSVESQYSQVLSEDGPYEAHVGYSLIAKTYNEGDKHADYYLHFHLFRDNKKAEKFVKRVQSVGEINEKHWEFIKRDHFCEIPYWATPEFAMRERMGTL